MSKKTRYFLAGSAAVLVIGLCTGLVAYYGGGFPSLSASRTGPAELSYVPTDATVVAFANVHDVMMSQFRQHLKEIVPEQQTGQDEFQRLTGINIESDITLVIAALLPGTGDEPSGFVVVRGRFNDSQLETLAREHGAEVSEYRGKKLVLLSHLGTHNGQQGALAFFEPGLIAIGDVEAIKRSLDAQLSATSITANDEMMNLVADIEGSSNAWAVGRFDVLASKARLPEQVASQIPPVKWFAVTSHVNGGVSGAVRAEARDEKAAEDLRAVVNGFLALARMQTNSDPKFNAIMQSVQLSGTGRTVTLSFAIPTDVFHALAAAAHGVHNPH